MHINAHFIFEAEEFTVAAPNRECMHHYQVLEGTHRVNILRHGQFKINGSRGGAKRRRGLRSNTMDL